MTSHKPDSSTSQNWKAQTLIIGAALGAVVGLAGAYLLVQQAEKEGRAPRVSAGEGVKLGVLLFGLLRQVATLHE
jgi:hypothetical protein